MTLTLAVCTLLATSERIPGRIEAEQVLSAKEVFKRTNPSVATITVNALGSRVYQGSGFMISKNRLATCWHVVSDAVSVMVQFPNSKPVEARIVSASPESDVAILDVNTSAKPIKLRTDRPSPGEPLYCIGAPEGLSGSINSGLMSSARMVDAGVVYQISNPVTHGNSGGPVLDDHGRVIGLVSFGFEKAAALNFAVPAATIKANLAANEPVSFSDFRDKRLPLWHTFMSRSRTGDDVLLDTRIDFVSGISPFSLLGKQRQQVLSVTEGIETRMTTYLSNTMIEEGKFSDLQPNEATIDKLDEFFCRIEPKFDNEREERIHRSTSYYPPTQIGLVLKQGAKWTREVEGSGNIPAGVYSAEFKGFEVYRGVRCAVLLSTYHELTGEHPITVSTKMLCVYGVESVHIESKFKNAPYDDLVVDMKSSLDVTYWKYGPPSFQSK